jgi:ankyrin repeat protein
MGASYPAAMDDRLHVAAATGDLATIQAAVAAGADLDVRDQAGRTPLMAATRARQTDAVRVLLEAEADVDLRDDQLDNPFLYAGAEGCSTSCAWPTRPGRIRP